MSMPISNPYGDDITPASLGGQRQAQDIEAAHDDTDAKDAPQPASSNPPTLNEKEGDDGSRFDANRDEGVVRIEALCEFAPGLGPSREGLRCARQVAGAYSERRH